MLGDWVNWNPRNVGERHMGQLEAEKVDPW